MEEYQHIVLKYFNVENIKNVQNFNSHVIVTLENAPEDEKKAEALKAELLRLENIKKASVVFTRQKEPAAKFEIEKWKSGKIKHIIGVASGKGGVGKSTTAVNIALALADLGQKVAIFDADIYGPSLPTMLSFENTPPVSYDGKIFEPFENFGVKAMSIGSLIDRDTPLVWRGAKACGAIEQMFCETNWGDVDVMVFDMPPGTGDIQITLAQRIDFDGMVIVSTPQDVALIDAVKGVKMFEKIGIKILGMVENMSYYICPHCNQKSYIFGQDGAKNTAARLGVRFLGEIPLNESVREQADSGTPIVAAAPDGEMAEAYHQIGAKILEALLKSK